MLALLVALGLTLLFYWPGLYGTFLFDDYANLNALGAFGGVDSWDTALRFIFGGHAGPSGRPIAMASFLLNAQNWPALPFPFKYDNLLFHLITGLLLAWLGLQLARALKLRPRRAAWAGVLTAALWLLHPYFVSTVLYPVQRMAILAALFVVAGLTLYVAGRLDLARGRARAGFIKSTIGVGLFTPLAFFSKENGALLPLLALVMDATVLTASPVAARLKRRYQVWTALLLYLPLLIIAVHFIQGWHSVLAGYADERFTFTQRLMTEPRILFHYLYNLFIPQTQTGGLYHDSYLISTGLLQPVTTLLSILGLAGALATAWLWRRRYPVLALAVLFFLAGHIIESSFVALDLYYEHRNYLPAMMLFFAAGYYLVLLAGKAPKKTAALAAILLAIFAGLTHIRSNLWSNLDKLALVWAQQNPSSPRAQQQAAIVLSKIGRPRQALSHIETAVHYHPHNPILRLQLMALHCNTAPVTGKDFRETRHWLHVQPYDNYIYRNLKNVIGLKGRSRCPELSFQDLSSLDRALLSNDSVQSNPSAQQKLLFIKAQLLMMQGESQKASQAVFRSFQAYKAIDSAMRLTGFLATHGLYDDALAMLDHAEYVLHHAPRSRDPMDRLEIQARNYPGEIARIRGIIRKQKAKKDDFGP